MNFTNEQLTKAKAAKSVEELLTLAKENGTELTEDEAKKFFAELHKEGELADDELNNVSGGGCYTVKPDKWFDEGEIVEGDAGIQYEIIDFDSWENNEVRWYRAKVKTVPEYAKNFTSYREGDIVYVNSGIVHRIS